MRSREISVRNGMKFENYLRNSSIEALERLRESPDSVDLHGDFVYVFIHYLSLEKKARPLPEDDPDDPLNAVLHHAYLEETFKFYRECFEILSEDHQDMVREYARVTLMYYNNRIGEWGADEYRIIDVSSLRSCTSAESSDDSLSEIMGEIAMGFCKCTLCSLIALGILSPLIVQMSSG